MTVIAEFAGVSAEVLQLPPLVLKCLVPEPEGRSNVMNWRTFCWLTGTCALVLFLVAVPIGCGPGESPDGGTPTDGDGPQAGLVADVVVIPVGLPPLDIPEDNPMTAEKIELGKMLYFDKRLSKDGNISCATCHDPAKGWTDQSPTSTGIGDQVGGANAPTVINAAYAKAQFWDGRAATLEEQALGPIENSIEMGHKLEDLIPELNEIEGYKERFQAVFGTDVTADGIAKAIAAFERTVLSGDSPYDKFKEGDDSALTDAQKRGLELFESAGCDSCHKPPLFSNYMYVNAGVGMDAETPHEGRKAVTGDDKDIGRFRVPSLREVANTGPYFHDGSAATLEEAVALMAGGGKDNDNLSPMLEGIRDEGLTEEQQKDIVEFLKALSGNPPVVEPPELP
jgi:cytochrome c peroxidase